MNTVFSKDPPAALVAIRPCLVNCALAATVVWLGFATASTVLFLPRDGGGSYLVGWIQPALEAVPYFALIALVGLFPAFLVLLVTRAAAAPWPAVPWLIVGAVAGEGLSWLWGAPATLAPLAGLCLGGWANHVIVGLLAARKRRATASAP